MEVSLLEKQYWYYGDHKGKKKGISSGEMVSKPLRVS